MVALSEESSNEKEPLVAGHQIITDKPLDDLKGIYRKMTEFRTIRVNSDIFHRNDFLRLLPNKWLNDKIINAYMELLTKHFKGVYAFSTHSYTLMRSKDMDEIVEWFKDEDLFSYNYIVVPLHLTNHWTLIIVQDSLISYYDSLGCLNNHAIITIKKLLQTLHAEKYNKEKRYFGFNASKNIVQQTNADDCGVFCCMYARYMLDPEADTLFLSSDIPMLRRRMFHEILAGKIIYPAKTGTEYKNIS
ncbi:sentrin-specific protease 1 [Enteropsectra breve]|nr:sentrin-specific protease 1 [Enteropsectra breve]